MLDFGAFVMLVAILEGVSLLIIVPKYRRVKREIALRDAARTQVPRRRDRPPREESEGG